MSTDQTRSAVVAMSISVSILRTTFSPGFRATARSPRRADRRAENHRLYASLFSRSSSLKLLRRASINEHLSQGQAIGEVPIQPLRAAIQREVDAMRPVQRDHREQSLGWFKIATAYRCNTGPGTVELHFTVDSVILAID